MSGPPAPVQDLPSANEGHQHLYRTSQRYLHLLIQLNEMMSTAAVPQKLFVTHLGLDIRLFLTQTTSERHVRYFAWQLKTIRRSSTDLGAPSSFQILSTHQSPTASCPSPQALLGLIFFFLETQVSTPTFLVVLLVFRALPDLACYYTLISK